MKRSAAWLTVLVALGGCKSSKPPLVYVDLDRAAASSIANLSLDIPTQPPTAPGATASELEPLEARRLDFSGNASRLAKVQEEVRIAQEETIRQLTAELRQSYLKEVDELERERIAGIESEKKEAFERAWGRLRTRFQQYADLRGPDAIRMAVYAGFPVIANAPNRDFAWNNAAKRQIADAQKLKTKLEELRKAYDADAKEILAQAGDEVAAILGKLRLEMEALREAAEKRARDEANKQTQEMVKDIESVLSGKSEVILPRRPGVKTSTEAVPSLPAPPTLDTRSTEALMRRSREAVRSEAEVWAALHGYTLTTEKGPTDRTSEFLEWRKRHHPGP